MDKTKHINLPIGLCLVALRERKVNQLKVFVYLKFVCSGRWEVNEGSIQSLCDALKISKRSYHTYMKWLLKNRWITVNSKKKHTDLSASGH